MKLARAPRNVVTPIGPPRKAFAGPRKPGLRKPGPRMTALLPGPWMTRKLLRGTTLTRGATLMRGATLTRGATLILGAAPLGTAPRFGSACSEENSVIAGACASASMLGTSATSAPARTKTLDVILILPD